MLKVKDAAVRVGLSVSQMNKLRCFGKGPAFYKLGHAVFYSAADLDAWLAASRRTSTWTGANDNQPKREAA